jgi:hypothetical protein
VHSGETSAPRAHSLEQLNGGQLDILFAVDMFNEGVDLPNVDTIMMLRPTESQILWLQQFGRGLRHRPGKRLQVIDYIGNHRTFLIKPRTLFQLGAGDGAIRQAFANLEAGTLELPPGCSVTYELEAKNIIERLLRTPQAGEALRAYYEDFVERHGARPLAVETFHDGYDPRSVRTAYGSWLSFVQAMGGLDDGERVALEGHGAFLKALEVTPMTRSFKMLVLLAMLDDENRPVDVPIAELCERVARLARRYAGLQQEFGGTLDDLTALQQLLETNPIAAWTGGLGTGGMSYFAYDGRTLRWARSLTANSQRELGRLSREIAEWRLASYLRRVDGGTGSEQIVCSVSHANGKPMLFLPAREKQPGIPEGWVPITADGVAYQANFVKIAVNVVRKAEAGPNVLPEILQSWFGTDAGRPGTAQRVAFDRADQGYVMRPLGVERPTAGPVLCERYMRRDIPPLFGLEFNRSTWEQGWVVQESGIILMVTLDKGRMQESHRYADKFLGPNRFQWQSQNQTTQASKRGQMVQHHRERGIPIHLFVRRESMLGDRAAPFVYCGELEFERWEGEKPITVWWRLKHAVPGRLRTSLGVPEGISG